MILVTGGTGTTGREVIRRLQASGEAVRVLTRDDSKARSRLGNKVEIVKGDLDEPATLPPALEGIERVFLLSAVDRRMALMCSNLILAAKDAGVKHVVRYSGIRADLNSGSEILRMHAQSDNELRDSGLGFTILQPNSFMQNLLWSARTVKKNGAILLPLRDAAMSLIDVRDIADVAHVVLTSPGHEGKTYVLTGPEAVSMSGVAEQIGIAVGKPVQYIDVPPAAAEQAMLDGGLPPWNAAAITELYMEFAQGGYDDVTDTIARVAGHPPRTLAEFVHEFVDSFR